MYASNIHNKKKERTYITLYDTLVHIIGYMWRDIIKENISFFREF